MHQCRYRGVSKEPPRISSKIMEEAVNTTKDTINTYVAWCDILDIVLDLREANLNEADLNEANLSWANLNGANLNEVDLDFSCLPLWCGSLKIGKTDRKQSLQILTHARAFIMACDDLEQEQNKDLRLAVKYLKKLTKQSHIWKYVTE